MKLRSEARRIEIEEETRRVEQSVVVVDNKTLLDYLAPPNQAIQSAICVPTIKADNFEMQVLLIQMM